MSVREKTRKRSSTPTVPTLDGEELSRLLCADVEIVEIDTLTPDPANARLHPEPNLQAIEASLRQFGQDQPLVVQREGRIVRKGNGRLSAMRRLGWKRCVVVWVNDDNWQAVARALADNRTAELATWDVPVLMRLMQELRDDGRETQNLGWTEGEIAALLDNRLPETSGTDAGNSASAPPDTSPKLEGIQYRVIVDCKDETAQAELVTRLESEGYVCRLLMS